MDYQRDYILRLIHMLGDLMRRLAERVDDRARGRMLDETCREFCGMPLEAAEALAPESLRTLLAPLPRLVLAELLLGKAQALTLPDDEQTALRLRALGLLASLYPESQLCELRAERLIHLKAELLPWLSAAELMDCARFFAMAERYDEMEDALFQALAREQGAQRDADRAEAAAMLRRAAHAPAMVLARSRMDAAELRASARELEIESTPQEQENPE